MIQKESRLDVADNSGAKVAMVIGTKGVSTARGRFTRVSVGVGDRIVCTVKKALPNADIKAGDKVQAVIVRINTSLLTRGYKVWFDLDMMKGSTLDAMSQAVVRGCHASHLSS